MGRSGLSGQGGSEPAVLAAELGRVGENEKLGIKGSLHGPAAWPAGSWHPGDVGCGNQWASVLKERDLALGLGGCGFGSCPTSF